jgi:undecaprenyl-diphosphatase
VRQIDLQVFHWINRWPDSFNPLFYSLSEGNKWLGVRLCLLAFLIYCLWKPKLRPAVLIALVAWPLANEICDLLKNGFQMLRPSVDVPDAIVRVNRLTSFGTASAHSANMMAVAVPFLYYARPIGIFWLGIAILTGFSRIYVGVHFPYQVVFGWFIGAAMSGVLIVAWEAWKQKKALRKEEPDAELPESVDA